MKTLSRTIAAILAAGLTVGTAQAQVAPANSKLPVTVYETADSSMSVTSDGCIITSKTSNQWVASTSAGTSIFSDGLAVVVLPNGEITSVNSPYPSDELRRLFLLMAEHSQKACASAIVAAGR